MPQAGSDTFKKSIRASQGRLAFLQLVLFDERLRLHLAALRRRRRPEPAPAAPARRLGVHCSVLVVHVRCRPPHDDLVLALPVRAKYARPLAHQDLDVALFFKTLLVAVGLRAADGVMLRRDRHAVAPDDTAVLFDVLRGVVIILLEFHLLVEAHRGLLRHEKIAENEVPRRDRRSAEAARTRSQRIHAGELRAPRRAQLRMEEPRRGNRRDDMAGRGGMRCVHSVVRPILRTLPVVVLPAIDVVGDLNANLAHPEGVPQALVPRLAQLAAHHRLQAEILVRLQAGLVNVPSRDDPSRLEVRFRIGDVLQALGCPRASSRHNTKVEVAGLFHQPAFLRRKQREKLFLARLLPAQLVEAQLAIEAIGRGQLPAQLCLNRLSVVEHTPLGADPHSIRAAISRRAARDWVRHLHALTEVVRKPCHPRHIHEDGLPLNRAPLARFDLCGDQRVTGALLDRDVLCCLRHWPACCAHLDAAPRLLLLPEAQDEGAAETTASELRLPRRLVRHLLRHVPAIRASARRSRQDTAARGPSHVAKPWLMTPAAAGPWVSSRRA
mmetsp:Transcript_48293/g.140842  ORF Transcript_48293/g.140842 Transcript_48293/m.140842 type:complete len:553 (-) Transcript_48293:8-1666(-)